MPLQSHRFWLLLAALALLSGLRPVCASGRAALTLAAAPDVVYADGKSTTVITVTVRDGGGNLAANGTSVHFTTTLGMLTPETVTTTEGVARVSLTSTKSAGIATVSAAAVANTLNGASDGTTTVEFTADRQSLFARDARWIRVDCPQYLIYSADSHIIEAHGKSGSAHLFFKALDITADSMQVDLQTETVLARQAVLQRGRHALRVAELRYDLVTEAGTAVLAGSPQSVVVTGYGLEATPQPEDSAHLPLIANPYRFLDLSDSHLVVSAHGITAAPGDQVQFRRATLYSDGKKLYSVPYHVMPINTDQIFGQQVVGVGSQGLFLNVPYYYNVTPHSRGTIFLRNAAVNGASLAGSLSSGTTFFGSQAARHGLALDLEQSYEFGKGGAGQFLVNGITRSEWGAQWTHTQRFDPQTTTSLFIDYPEHRSLYVSSNTARQFRGFSLNLNAAGSNDPGIDGYSASSRSLSTSLQTDARLLGRSGVSYTAGLAVQAGTLNETSPDTGTVVTPISTRTASLSFFTAPLHPDKRTQLTDSLLIGEAFGGQGATAPTVNLSVGLTRTFRRTDSFSLNYTYRYDPLLSQIGTPSSDLNPLEALLRSPTQQRVTATYVAVPLPRLQVSLSGGYGLPLNDRSLFASTRYHINNDWGVGLAASFEQYVVDRYSDVQYSVSRRILGRDLIVFYSPRTRRLSFDFAGAGWQ